MHNPFIVLSILRPILKTSQTGYVVIRHPMVTENFFSSCCFALLFALFAVSKCSHYANMAASNSYCKTCLKAFQSSKDGVGGLKVCSLESRQLSLFNNCL